MTLPRERYFFYCLPPLNLRFIEKGGCTGHLQQILLLNIEYRKHEEFYGLLKISFKCNFSYPFMTNKEFIINKTLDFKSLKSLVILRSSDLRIFVSYYCMQVVIIAQFRHCQITIPRQFRNTSCYFFHGMCQRG